MARPWSVLLMALAVAILYGALSRVWAQDGDLVHVGPTGVEICIARAPATTHGETGPIECRVEPASPLPADTGVLGWIVLFGGFASAALCAYCARQHAREHRLPFALAFAILAITAAAMIAFEARLLTIDANLSLGSGCPVGLGGALAAIATLVLLRRVVERG